MKLQVEIHNKEGLKDKDINRVIDFLETINYDDMRDILDGGYITLGNDDFLTFNGGTYPYFKAFIANE